MEEFVKCNREKIVYLFCGISTTVVNYFFFTIFSELNIDVVVSNVLAFAIAVTFAFFTNKFLVFQSFSREKLVMIKEFKSFVSLRIISMLIETTILYIFVELLLINKYLIKFLASIIVVVLNYIFGKFITFKKG